MNQYIITEEQLKRIMGMTKPKYYEEDLAAKLVVEVRSHPYNPQAEQKEQWCGNCGFKNSKDCADETTWKRCRLMSSEPEGKNVEARIELARQAGREKVLDELTKWREEQEYHLGMFHKLEEYETLWKKEWTLIKALRQEGKVEK